MTGAYDDVVTGRDASGEESILYQPNGPTVYRSNPLTCRTGRLKIRNAGRVEARTGAPSRRQRYLPNGCRDHNEISRLFGFSKKEEKPMPAADIQRRNEKASELFEQIKGDAEVLHFYFSYQAECPFQPSEEMRQALRRLTDGIVNSSIEIEQLLIAADDTDQS